MKKKIAYLMSMFIIVMSMVPLPVGALAQAPPQHPFEKVVYGSGGWETFHWDDLDDHKLAFMYHGAYNLDMQALETMPQDVLDRQASGRFRISSDHYLSKFAAVYAIGADDYEVNSLTGGLPPAIDLYLQHHDTGQVFGPFNAAIGSKIQAVGVNTTGQEAAQPDFYERDYVAVMPSPLLLEKGLYYYYFRPNSNFLINQQTGYGGAAIFMGYDAKALDAYSEKLLAYELEALSKDLDEEALIQGNPSLYQTFIDDKAEEYPINLNNNPAMSQPFSLTVKEPMRVSNIGINTGKLPAYVSQGQDQAITTSIETLVTDTAGSFQIINEVGQMVYNSAASHVALGSNTRGLAVAKPEIVLPPGEYAIAYTRPETVVTQANGQPDIFIKAAPAPVPEFYATGTYSLNIDAYKTSTLMGSVSGGESSFSLKNHQLGLIDQGETLQITTQYEGMPFSLMARVTERTPDSVTAYVEMSTDLSKTPVGAMISTNDTLTISKNNQSIVASVNGDATYSRAATKDKGADFNTYRVEGAGYRLKETLPPYVVTALKRQGLSAGQIPGPDNPIQIPIGLIFPAAVGLIGHIAQQVFEQSRRQMPFNEGKTSLDDPGFRELSVGEKAMKEANHSMADTLVDEDHKRAMKILAEAMGNTDNPDENDQISIGDNERSVSTGGWQSGDGQEDAYDYEVALEPDAITTNKENPDFEVSMEPDAITTSHLSPAELAEREALVKEKEEWEDLLKSSEASAEASDRTEELHQEYKDYISHLENTIHNIDNPMVEPLSMEVQVDHTGRKEVIIYNEDEDTWEVESSGNPFDMEKYQKDVVPEFGKTNEFLERQRQKFKERDTAFDRYLDEQKAKQQAKDQLMNKLLKERNKAFEMAPPEDGMGRVGLKYEEIIDKLADDDITYEEAQNLRKKAFKVLNGRMTGRTMSEREADDIKAEDTFVNAAIESAKATGEEVLTGDTKLGMAARILIAVGTGGASEFVMAPAEALVDMKRMIDSDFADKAKKYLKSKGVNIDGMSEAELVASLAIGKFVMGEAIGEGAGYVASGAGKVVKRLVKSELGEQGAKEFFEYLGEKSTKAMTKVMNVADTPVSKVMKNVKEGAEKKLKDVSEAISGKKALKEAAEAEKLFKEQVDYTKYRVKVTQEAKEIKNTLKSGKDLSEDSLASSLRDTGVSRELKKTDRATQEAFAEQLDNKIYKPANEETLKVLKEDKNLVKDIEGLGEGDYEIDLVQIRTPKKEGTWSSPVNADNDMYGRVKIFDKDAAGNIKLDADGNPIVKKYVEVPAEKVEKVYREKFAEKTGYMKDGKFDVDKAAKDMPEGIEVVNPQTGKYEKISWQDASPDQRTKAILEKHNQEVTDLKNVESAKDFSKFTNADHVSNMEKIKSGDYSDMLEDANELANMEYSKIQKFIKRGDTMNTAEGMIQTGKLTKLTTELNDAYQKAGYDVKPLDASFKKALDVVNNDALSPAARNLELNKLGFKDASDLANKCSSQIEHLKQAKPGNILKAGAGSSVKPPVSGGKYSIGKAIVNQQSTNEMEQAGGMR